MFAVLQMIGIFLAVFLFCLWGAICVLSIGGWLFTGRRPLPQDYDTAEHEEELPGLTWRDPTLWIVAFFIWPVLVALQLDYWWKRRSR